MTILGIGVDMVTLSRIQSLWVRFDQAFAERILSPQEHHAFSLLLKELPSSTKAAAFLAKAFACKEAACKALGTGINHGVRWCDISTVRDAFGAPKLSFLGKAKERADAQGVQKTHVSLTDDNDLICAFCVLSS